MNPESNSDASIPATRLLYWAVRRELWENRSLYLAPLAVAGLILIGFLISTVSLPARIRADSVFGALGRHNPITQHFLVAAGMMMLTTLAVGAFYSLDALYGERRDRSILFWKSLPVSDLITVLAKALVPIVILPLVTFAIAAIMQLIMLLVSSAVLWGNGLNAVPVWTRASLFEKWLILLYHFVTVHGLWYAPIYGWLLLVSAWARRAPFLWAILPPLAVAVTEKIAFNTWYFGTMVANRMIGGGGGAEDFMTGYLSMDPLMHFSPAAFLVSPGLWIGLAVAAAFLGAAVRLRRYRDPI
jgi:ABC-2 type transport system permease protein